MKKIFLIIMSLIMVANFSFAGTNAVFKKEANRLAKEGWRVKSGGMPLEKQLEISYLMNYEFDEDLNPKYISGEASFVDENYDLARVNAQSLAITKLAANIQVEICSLVEKSVSENQLSFEDAETISKIIMNNQFLIIQSITNTIPIIECYRTNKKENEVLIHIACRMESAKGAIKKAVRDELEKNGNNLNMKLDKVLGF